MKYLITQSLVSSWNYLMDCHESCEDEAYESFLRTLNREQTETTPAMQNGIDFENEIYATIAGQTVPHREEWKTAVELIADRLKHATTQVKASKDILVGETELLLYGVFDALWAGQIFDIKYSNKSFGSIYLPGKYLSSPQHPAYFCLCPEARRFTYIVSDGTDIYEESYTPEHTIPFTEIAYDFLNWLDGADLLETYKEKWACLPETEQETKNEVTWAARFATSKEARTLVQGGER